MMRRLLIIILIMALAVPVYAQDTDDLTETYTNEHFSIQYPPELFWLPEDFGLSFSNARLSTENALALAETEDLPTGTLLGSIFLPEMLTSWFGEGHTLEIYYGTVCPEAMGCGEPSELEWHSGDAIYFEMDDPAPGITRLGIIAEVKDGFLIMIVMMDADLLETWEPTLLKMFQSIEYSPLPVVTPDPVFEDISFSEAYEFGTLEVGHAPEWGLTISASGVLVLASDASRLTRAHDATLTENEFMLSVYPTESFERLGITLDAPPPEVLQAVLSMPENQAEYILELQLGDFPAATIGRPQREYIEHFYAVRLNDDCTVVVSLITNPAAAEKFIGILPLWLGTISCAG